jgi:hypothetical protein
VRAHPEGDAATGREVVATNDLFAASSGRRASDAVTGSEDAAMSHDDDGDGVASERRERLRTAIGAAALVALTAWFAYGKHETAGTGKVDAARANGASEGNTMAAVSAPELSSR